MYKNHYYVWCIKSSLDMFTVDRERPLVMSLPFHQKKMFNTIKHFGHAKVCQINWWYIAILSHIQYTRRSMHAVRELFGFIMVR